MPSTVGISSLTDLSSARLIDFVLAGGEKSGYSFIGDWTVQTPTEPKGFYFAANPVTASGVMLTGTRRYGVATDGVIRFDATAADLATPFDAITLAAATPMGD